MAEIRHYPSVGRSVLAPRKAEDRIWYTFAHKQGLEWTCTCVSTWTAGSVHPIAHSPIHENNQLTPPRCRLENFDDWRSFAVAAPALWKDLPLNIKQSPSVDILKPRMKTHLFQLAYFMQLCEWLCLCYYFMLCTMEWVGVSFATTSQVY